MFMKYFWTMLNWILVALSFWGGYKSMTPERLRHTNPDALLCLIILIITPVFAFGIVEYSIRRWKVDQLAWPTWTRNPFNWWGDPLQSLFISTCLMGAMAIGSATQHPTFESVGFWTLGMYSCSAIGLLVGQILVYRIHRRRIASITQIAKHPK
jgi:hypothetical protein